MHYLRVWLRHYFGFSTKESNGFLILALIILFVLSLPAIYSQLLPEPESVSAEIEILKADTILPTLKSSKKEVKNIQLFEFDPNTASTADFENLGLNKFLASRIDKYRRKGGKFKQPQDFSKIYGLAVFDFERLRPYIIIKQEVKQEFERKEYPKNANKTEAFIPIDINLADTANLKKINGIGSVLSKRILKYRNSLGGFVNEKQLLEVYGLDTSVATKLAAITKFDGSNVKKLQLNHLPQDSLAKHPYIGRKAAKILVNYRQHHGNFKSLEDIRNSKALEPDKLNKLSPYLTF